MAAPILTTMMSNVRQWIQDTDTTVSSAFSDAQLTTFINAALMWWYENNEKRVKSVTIDTTASGELQTNGDATFLYPEIFAVYVTDPAATGPVPLVRIGWNDLKVRQNRSAVTDFPAVYARLKTGAGAVAAASQNKWLLAMWPVPNGAYTVTAIVRDYPVALSAGADIVDLGDFEAKCVEIIAAIFAAPRMNRPELAQDLMGLLPKMIQDKLATHESQSEVTA